MKKLSRGHRLRNAAIDAIIPIQTKAIISCEPHESQKSVGAYQYRSSPASPRRASRKLCAGKMPWGPFRPSI